MKTTKRSLSRLTIVVSLLLSTIGISAHSASSNEGEPSIRAYRTSPSDTNRPWNADWAAQYQAQMALERKVKSGAIIFKFATQAYVDRNGKVLGYINGNDRFIGAAEQPLNPPEAAPVKVAEPPPVPADVLAQNRLNEAIKNKEVSPCNAKGSDNPTYLCDKGGAEVAFRISGDWYVPRVARAAMGEESERSKCGAAGG